MHQAAALGLLKAAGLHQGQAEYQTTLNQACFSQKRTRKQQDSIRDYRLSSTSKSDWRWEKIALLFKISRETQCFHHGAKQFSELEAKTAWDHSSSKEWHARFTQGSRRHHILCLARKQIRGWVSLWGPIWDLSALKSQQLAVFAAFPQCTHLVFYCVSNGKGLQNSA